MNRLLVARISVGLAFFGVTVPVQVAGEWWAELIGLGCGVYLALLALAFFNDPALESNTGREP